MDSQPSVVTTPTPKIEPAWSYSVLEAYETCPKRYYHYKVQKDIIEPEGPQLREGNQLHAAFDARISKGQHLPLGFGQYEPLLANVVNSPGETHAERKLAITAGFQPTAYFANDVWFRTVLDAAKIVSDYAVIFDWKNGRPKEDITQLQLMSATVFHHMPGIQRIRAALVFVQHNKTEKAEFTRNDLPEIWGEILPRVKKMQRARADQEFPPKPSGLCKKYCAVISCPHHGVG